MPFNGDIIRHLVVLSVAFFYSFLSNKAGMLLSEHPDSPRNSMLQPVLQAAMNTVRMIDNLTDMRTLRLVMRHV
jgi:hypothetical protein